MIRVCVSGRTGKMGQEVIRAVNLASDMELAATAGREDNLAEIVVSCGVDVVVDFTHPSTVFDNVINIVRAGKHAVVGTTGLSHSEIEQINSEARSQGVGVLIAPNFSLGAVLAMKCAADIARYFKQASILEYHHDEKADAPSGTAIHTAEYILAHAGAMNPPKIKSEERYASQSLGVDIGNIPVHAVRLPGFIASQEIVFGGQGETIHIRHDSMSRECFIPGVLLAVRKISSCRGVVIGLEDIL